MQDFVFSLQDWSLCFPQSCGNPIIKSHWPSRPHSLGILIPLWDPKAGMPDVGFRTFTTVAELLLYYCSPVCGSPTQRVGDLILSWLHPTYCLAVASSLSLDVEYCFFFWWVPASSRRGRASCSLAILVFSQEEMSMSFYFAILNRKSVVYDLFKVLLGSVC